jgi:hypothetical protein
MTDATPRRLPIEIVVKRSFLYAWESREVLAAPFAIYVVVTILAEIVLGVLVGSKSHGPLYLLSAAEQVFAVAFAVGLHRFVLLGEVQAGPRFFRWDRHFVQYVVLTLLLLIMALAAAIIVMGALGTDGTGGAVEPGAPGALFGLAVMLGVALVLSRLALALPAAALGERKRPREIWQATEGNSFRLLGATLLTALPFLIVEAALSRLMPEPRGDALEILMTVAEGVLSAMQLTVVTVMLSLSYDVLIRGGGPPPK